MTALALVACAHSASALNWVGMAADQGAGTIELFALSGYATRGQGVATVPINSGETVSVDSFRCRPGGTFCIFTTNDGKSNSFLYNVSVYSGSLNSRTPVPGATIHNLHVDMATGAAYTVALAEESTKIVSIYGGAVETLIDLTSYVTAGETVPPAGTTQCSDTDVMWVGVKAAGGAPDRIITAHLPTRNVTGVRKLKGSLPASLWASCDDQTKQNFLAGAVSVDGGASVSYATINAEGGFDVLESAPVPEAGLELSGLLTQPPSGYAYFMGLYPAGSKPGSNTTGYVAFGENRAGGSLTVKAIDYFLVGAAAIF